MHIVVKDLGGNCCCRFLSLRSVIRADAAGWCSRYSFLHRRRHAANFKLNIDVAIGSSLEA